MKKIVKPVLFLVPLIILFALYGCAGNIKTSKYFSAKYTEVIALVAKNNSAEIYNITNGKLDKLGSIPNVSDLIYNFNNTVYVYLLNIPGGQNLQHNNIKIEDKNGNRQLDSSYSSLDLKISKDGSKLAYRSFNKDSYDGAEGIKLYDIEETKKIKFKTQVLISGNLYQWLTNKDFIYYGIEEGKQDSGKIYRYNLDTNKEDIYLNNINGYCTFFYPINDSGIVYIEENINESRLMYKDIQGNKANLVSNSIGTIFSSTFEKESNCLYFIALEKNENKTLLFKLSLKDMALSRLNFDFPNEIDKNGGLALDANHNLYFCGLVKANENNNNIYTYNCIDTRITLITNHDDRYYLGGNNK
jgi:hypothetical protein